MSITVTPPPTHEPVRDVPKHRRTGRRHRALVTSVAVTVVLAVLATTAAIVLHRRWDDRDRHYLGANGWPVHGQAAYALGGQVYASPDETAVPIASLAKVMTAYLVLRAHPLTGSRPGFTVRITAADVADTARRRDQQQSVVAVRAGERLTERQALLALLLPSANNVAAVLARHEGGSVKRFVARMNAASRRLGMRHTLYTDPSGYAPSTVSTAHDQVLLARAANRDATFRTLVAQESARLPVAGVVHTTDFLLGTRGFVGTKTGSDDAAGGCFMFRTYRVVHRQLVTVDGVVLGQQGHSYLAAGQYAAAQLADRISPMLPG